MRVTYFIRNFGKTYETFLDVEQYIPLPHFGLSFREMHMADRVLAEDENGNLWLLKDRYDLNRVAPCQLLKGKPWDHINDLKDYPFACVRCGAGTRVEGSDRCATCQGGK
jgi:hypothetical protein